MRGSAAIAVRPDGRRADRPALTAAGRTTGAYHGPQARPPPGRSPSPRPYSPTLPPTRHERTRLRAAGIAGPDAVRVLGRLAEPGPQRAAGLRRHASPGSPHITNATDPACRRADACAACLL